MDPIGIAVVEHRGRYLVGIRPAGLELAGFSEFPGGKCRPGESSGVCACRECLEETGLEVYTVELLMRRSSSYPHGTFDLNFWLCRPSPKATVTESHNGYRWVPASELASLKFPEANAPLIELLGKAKPRGQ
ncbi:MAG: (deoxy)nucleoside triphosphate pyrophosphohydrolase [Planctomycetaceae bacterium]